jgi:hypothetical protein
VELRQNLTLLQQLGGEFHDVTSEMSQAALIQADGRVGEALSLLRDAQSRVGLRATEMFERRLKELTARQESLSKDGVGVDFSDEVAALHADFDAGRRIDALDRLVRTDQALSRVESDWRGLRGLLQQIDSLREASSGAGSANAEVEADLAEVRRLVSRPKLDTETLDTASQTAARALMLLHEALPATLEAELENHRATLATFSKETELTRQGRLLHAEASRHLRRGRLADTGQRLRELRSVIRALGDAPAGPSGPEDTSDTSSLAPELGGGAGALSASDAPTLSPAPSDEDPLGRLLQKARGLAARVRTLPPDSEVAFEAASEIRRATELLRARKLEEADQTLTRLMNTLDTEHPAEA